MARTTPVHAGYTILNGAGTGANGNRIDVWVEYKLGTQSVTGNYTPISAYFYAALNPSYTSSTSYASGLNSSFTVDGKAGTAVSNGAYDFSSAAKVNLLGSFSGNIAHGADGTKSVRFLGSFTTVSSYISGGSIDKTVSLPAIARASSVTAQGATLGSACCVSWTPASAGYSFTLGFSLGDWKMTTGRLSPNTTGKYTYTGTTLPLEAARQFSGKSGKMTVTLTTYSGNTVLGSDAAEFTVTVPENEDTRPTVEAVLTPACEAFPGLYVQRLGRVEATVTAQDPLGAQITAVYLSVGNATLEGTVSDYLEQAGSLTVTVSAVSSRGFTGTYSAQIQVLPYDSPRITASAYRCLSDGTADDGGTCLHLTASQSFSPVSGMNESTLYWRYKTDGGSYSDFIALTENGVVSGVVLEKNLTYTVQVQARDSAGSTAQSTLKLPMEQVYMHRTPNAMGLGGYAQGEQVLDIHWDIRARKSLSGAYIRTVDNADSFVLRFTGLAGMALMMGVDIWGTVTLKDGTAVWSGTAGVQLSASEGAVTVTLPASGRRILILSPDPIEI